MIKNIEKLTFRVDGDGLLHFAKQELLSQINNLDISISGKGFFTINRQFSAGVRLSILFITHTMHPNRISTWKTHKTVFHVDFFFRWQQLVAHTSLYLFNFIGQENKWNIRSHIYAHAMSIQVIYIYIIRHSLMEQRLFIIKYFL